MNLEKEAEKKQKQWFWLANIWRAIDYLMVIIAFLSSIVVVCVETMVQGDNTHIVIVGSTVAATFTMMSFAIEPKKHMKSYRNAYIHIYEKRINYIKNGKPEDTRVLGEAIINAESMINQSYDVDK